ncbi:MAG: addiction module protein [Verrucomicrobia bacterium]|nr:addiction module protein [Verrucomicrobiota bacterium]
MKTVGELEQQVLQLDESERARLAARLLDSLPAVVVDDDEGIAEAVRRDAELEQDTERGMTLEELRRLVQP